MVEKFWKKFLEETGRDPETKYVSSLYFGIDEKMADELLTLVLDGTKRATTSSLLGYQSTGERVPQEGDLSIVTDWNGNPKCVIEDTAVTTMLFKDMTFEICKREGEDDNLESWRNNHIKCFTEEAKEYNYEFSEDMPIIFEDFKVIYRV